MSKRLTTSAVIATLMMVATTFYGSAKLGHSETASQSTAVVLMGG